MNFGKLNPGKIWHEHLTYLSNSPVRCSHFTLGNSSHFSILLLVYFRLFTLPQKKTNSNCCTAALAVNLLLFSASYYLHSPSTVDVFWNSVVPISLAQTKTIFCEHIIDYDTAWNDYCLLRSWRVASLTDSSHRTAIEVDEKELKQRLN